MNLFSFVNFPGDDGALPAINILKMRIWVPWMPAFKVSDQKLVV